MKSELRSHERLRTAHPRTDIISTTLCFGVLAALVVGCSGSGTSPEHESPRIVVTPAILDLGAGAPGEVLTGNVEIHNLGGNPLPISGLRLGCSCLSASLSSPTVPAGESVTLTVSARVKSEGSVLSFPISIHGSDPAEPIAVVQVRAAPAQAPIRPELTEINCGMIPLGESPRTVVRLLNPSGGKSFSPDCQLDFKCPPAMFDAHIQAEATETERSFALIVSPKPTSPLGPLTETLQFRFRGSGKEWNFTVPVKGTITRRVIAMPNTVYFDDTGTDRRVVRVVKISRVDGRPLAPLQRIEAPPTIKAEEEASEAGTGGFRTVRLILDLGATANQEFEANLLIWVDGETEPVKVRLTGPRRAQ